MTLTIPLGDVVGRANYTYAKLDLEQAQARLKRPGPADLPRGQRRRPDPRDRGQERRRLSHRPRAGRAAARGRDEEAQRRDVDELLRPDLPGRPGQRPVARRCGPWSTTTSPWPPSPR
ncbi:MAG: hypothetical protein MZV63_65170 [Marinilabiliales bacterium]|nr:hypothetical protein [Marinilabiliales bacterium]